MCGMRKLRTLDIVDYVKAKKRCTLAHLMQKFKVSSATIHRDVAELVAAGHLERVRGGGNASEGGGVQGTVTAQTVDTAQPVENAVSDGGVDYKV